MKTRIWTTGWGAVAVLGTTLLAGCGGTPAKQSAVLTDEEISRAVAEAADEKVCVYEKPVGSTIKQKICETRRERELRQMISSNQVYRDGYRPLDRGCTDGRRVGC